MAGETEARADEVEKLCWPSLRETLSIIHLNSYAKIPEIWLEFFLAMNKSMTFCVNVPEMMRSTEAIRAAVKVAAYIAASIQAMMGMAAEPQKGLTGGFWGSLLSFGDVGL